MAHDRIRVLGCLVFASLAVAGCNRKVDDDKVASHFKMSKENAVALRRSTGASTRSLVKLRPEALSSIAREVRLPDLPQARARYEQLLEQSELGHVPAGARSRAVQRLVRLKDLIGRRRYAVAGVPVSANRVLARSAGIDPERVKWLALGPSEVGGRTRSMVINPKNPKEMWIASVAGGIWHSDDGGDSFTAADDFMKNMVVTTLVADSTHGVIYAGTGEGFLNSDALRGAGIFRTKDGLHWTQIPGTDNEHFRYVNRLAISADDKILLAATNDGIFVSGDTQHDDWSTDPTLSGSIADVVYHSKDSKLAVAGGAMDTGEVYYSEDGGASWHKSTHEGSWVRQEKGRAPRASRVEVTYASADPRVVYASVDTNSGELWRSGDGGKTFSKMPSETVDGTLAYYLGEQGWYDNSLWAGDKDPNFVIIGGVDLWKTVDGGKTLSPISDGQNPKNVLHTDQHVIVSPQTEGSSSLFVGNDGGLFKTNDRKSAGSDSESISGWTKIAHKYAVTQFYAAAWSPTTGTLFGGAQDNGTLRLWKDGKPEDWSELFGGDGGYCAADPVNGNYLYGEYVFLDIFRSSDGGKTAEEISGQFWNEDAKQLQWKQPPYVIPDARDGKANFIAPFALDPNNPGTILAGGASLWRTDDARSPNDSLKGPQWRSIKPPIADYISAIAVPKQDSRRIWVGHNNGDIFFTLNGNAANPKWKLINRNLFGLPKRIVTRIVFDPVDMNTVYLTYGGYNEPGARDNVWRTTNGGKTWSNISGSLPSVPAFALTVNPENRTFVYLGTEVGLFASEDMGSHWSPTTVEPQNEGPTNAAVMDLVWMNTSLVAVTHGRGLFSVDINGSKKPK
jgi:photosystem II stability/assembly factor-like uncharacterized protein